MRHVVTDFAVQLFLTRVMTKFQETQRMQRGLNGISVAVNHDYSNGYTFHLLHCLKTMTKTTDPLHAA